MGTLADVRYKIRVANLSKIKRDETSRAVGKPVFRFGFESFITRYLQCVLTEIYVRRK